MSLIWTPKDPAETVDYEVDWTARLAGDTIASSSWSIGTAAGLTQGSDSNTTTTATITLSDGTAGEIAKLTNTITTAGARTYVEQIMLPMAGGLIVEDGAGLTSAQSFCSVDQADAYHGSRQTVAWMVLGLAAKEWALRQATDYMEQAYRARWGGMLHSTTQALAWPRDLVEMKDAPAVYPGVQSYYYPANIVPAQVANACAELAARASAAPLLGDLSQGIKSRTVGPIIVEYDTGTPQSKRYPAIDKMLEPFLQGGGGITLVRG